MSVLHARACLCDVELVKYGEGGEEGEGELLTVGNLREIVDAYESNDSFINR
jgi:hypothetical protein